MSSRREPVTKAGNIAGLKEAQKNRPEGEKAPRMLVLVGIPGSGKSTFASFMEALGFQIVCQDVLGNRKVCEQRTVDHLLEGRNVVIDRCNFDASQRKHWVDYGKACGAELGVIVFGTPLNECLKRVHDRPDHPTLFPGGASDGVVLRMSRDFVFPTQQEGFGFCRIIRDRQDAERVYAEISKWIGVG